MIEVGGDRSGGTDVAGLDQGGDCRRGPFRCRVDRDRELEVCAGFGDQPGSVGGSGRGDGRLGVAGRCCEVARPFAGVVELVRDVGVQGGSLGFRYSTECSAGHEGDHIEFVPVVHARDTEPDEEVRSGAEGHGRSRSAEQRGDRERGPGFDGHRRDRVLHSIRGVAVSTGDEPRGHPIGVIDDARHLSRGERRVPGPNQRSGGFGVEAPEVDPMWGKGPAAQRVGDDAGTELAGRNGDDDRNPPREHSDHRERGRVHEVCVVDGQYGATQTPQQPRGDIGGRARRRLAAHRGFESEVRTERQGPHPVTERGRVSTECVDQERGPTEAGRRPHDDRRTAIEGTAKRAGLDVTSVDLG